MSHLINKVRIDLFCCIGLLCVSALTVASPKESFQKPNISERQSINRLLQTAELEIVNIERTVILPMLSQPLQSARLFSRVSGFITARYADIGDKVEKNEILATIDNPQLIAHEKKILADINEVESELELNQLNFKRAEQLVTDNLVSSSELDRLRILVSRAQARIASLKAELEGNLSRQSFLDIRAPFAGYIVAKRLEVGDLASADALQKERYFFEIANTIRLRLNIRVPQNEIRYIAVGDEVLANFTGYQNLSVKGHITRLSRAVDEQSGTMLVEAEIDNSDYNLPAGLRGAVSLKLSAGSKINKVWKAPLSAISYHNGHDAVVGVINGEIKFHKVDIVSKTKNSVLLRGDLNDVSKVVLNPNALLIEDS